MKLKILMQVYIRYILKNLTLLSLFSVSGGGGGGGGSCGGSRLRGVRSSSSSDS